MSDTIESRLEALGITIPSPATPAANYVPFVRSGNLLFISGQITMDSDGIEFVGKLGDTMEVEEGKRAAQLCAINILAQAKAALGSLEAIGRVVKLTGFVNSTPDFGEQPAVINGASDLIVDVLGDAGRHSRSAVGVANLPFGVAVEVEAIIEAA